MAGARSRAQIGIRILGTALVLALLAAGPSEAKPKQRPIVYVVVIDGLDGDRIEAGKAPFILSLLDGDGASATYFPNSSSVIPAETNPNHTAMMSGAYPGSSGIAANSFAIYAPLANEDTCATTGPPDLRALPTETSGESSTCPEAEMVFEAIKEQGNPDRLATAAVFGKPKLGLIFSGENFAPGERDVDYLWAPCSSGPEDDEYCADVPVNPISSYAVDDKTVMDAVLNTLGGVPLPYGRARPDFTFVNLHQVDSAGHAFGTGPVYDLAISQADDEIERLVGALRARGEWERTTLILASDHSMDTTPRKVSLTGAFEDGGIAESEFLATSTGSVDLVYVADRTSPARFELLARMRAIALDQPGVAEALYREPNPTDGGDANTLDGAHPNWHTAGERTGDLFVTAAPGTSFGEPATSANPLPGNHGAAQTADNFLAVTGGGPLVRQGTPAGPARAERPVNVDLAPTVMGLLGLSPSADSTRARFLRRAFERGQLRRGSRPHPPRVKMGARRLTVGPPGIRFEAQARSRGRWRSLGRKVGVKRVRVPRSASRLRVRTRSAAGIKSRWVFVRR